MIPHKMLRILLPAVALSCLCHGYGQSIPATGPGRSNDTLVVHFDYKRSEIRPGDSLAIARRVRSYGGGYQLLGIDLYGYCDSIGGDPYNMQLSRERIQAVIWCLYYFSAVLQEKPKGIHAYGREQPLNDNGNEGKRQLNRRVLIVFHLREADSTPTLAEAFQDSAVHAGKNVVLKNLNFYPGRHELLPASLPILDELVGVLNDHPAMRIEIQGHVCCVEGDRDGVDADAGTYDLSVQRALYVFRYLVLHGIEKSRLTYKGYGAGHKLYPEEKDERERDGNRRVEVHVVSW
jgi:outer membrane protein OmpA-like peptidoglycan-associated protein